METANPDSKVAGIAEKAMSRFDVAWEQLRQIIPSFELLLRYCRPSRDVVATMYGANNYAGSATTRMIQHHIQLYSSKMIRANLQHASGVVSWMSPPTTPWFQLRPAVGLRGDDEVEAWHSAATQAMQEVMAVSTFSGENHEAILDGSACGPRALTALEGDEAENPVLYRALEPGAYAIGENPTTGRVDSVYQLQKYTPKQAAQKFGEKSLPKRVRDKLLDPKMADAEDQKEEYVQCIYPRELYERDITKVDQENYPIASIWMHKDSRELVANSGFMEMPGAFSRYLRWGGSAYGYSPSMLAIADGRQLNSLEHMLDLMAEVKINPRILMPEKMEDRSVKVNLRPGGISYYPGTNSDVVKTWGTEGDYALGNDRVKRRERCIDEAFHLDVFNAFRDITKEITATEAELIRDEAITSFSPTFALMGSEHYTPILMRTFAILLRKSMIAHAIGDTSRMYFPLPPKKMLVDLGNGRAELPPPSVTYVSKMAYRLNQVHNVASRDALERRVTLVQATGDPSLLDDLKLPVMLGELERDAGLPERWRRTGEEVEAIQKARAEQQQQQMAAEMAEKGSKAAANLAKAQGGKAA